ncbi:hypothetical protein WA1_49990 [Scytonema hofmannii PCC 7110]|uniref:Uncharacterized protein n=1 Tax=Scytonema hofmannii PCC 7110 TaxID=128403 RepID=A0A139WR19_9CYAN|nr:hypothetical protein [Scytonema hofmannii]KYC34862.1 hypothetical protein WA1_49990 [Scytonema hofmannii PCC 7110]
MKALVIRTAFILTIPLDIALFQVSVSSFAYAKDVNQSNTSACESIPPARPTGGASSTRLQTMQQCYKRFQQSTPTGATNQTTIGIPRQVDGSKTGDCVIPPARPAGGAIMERLQALQRCN